MVSLILWIPYAFLALILVISFLLVGRKRGVLRALISLASTLVLGILALLLAKAIAAPLAGLLSSRLGPLVKDLIGELPVSLTELVLTALTETALAIVLYGLLLLLLECVGKPVISHFTKKITEKNKPKGWNVAGGLLVSLADALILAYLFVMPLYGTLSLTSKAVNTAAVFAADTFPAEVTDAAETAEKHPLIFVARTKPCALAYDTLTTFRYGSGSMSLSRVADQALETAKGLAAMKNGDVSPENQVAMIDALEKLLISGGEDSGKLLVNLTGLLGDQEELSFLTDFLNGISEKGSMEENVHQLADLARAAAQRGLLNPESLNEDVLMNVLMDREFLGQVTKTMNGTPELAKMKNDLIKKALSSVNTETPAVGKLLEQLTSKPVTDTEREADALYQIINAAQKAQQPAQKENAEIGLTAELLEGLARHPNLGPEAVMNAAKELLGGEDAPEAVKSDSFMNVLEKRLNESVEKPVGEGTLAPFVESAAKTSQAVTKLTDHEEGAEQGAAEAFASLITADKDVVKDMSSVLSEDLLVSSGMNEEAAGKMNELLKDALDTAAETEATEQQAASEGEKMAYVLKTVNKVGEGVEVEEAIDDKQKFIDSIVTSRVLADTVEKQVKKEDGTLTSDPSGLFADLSVADRQTLKNELDAYKGTHSVTNEGQKTLDQLAAFLGLDR